MEGLKERQLVNIGPCAICNKPQLEGGEPTFYLVTVKRVMFNANAIQRRAGLQMAMGGAGALAGIMGPDEDLATIFESGREVFIHESCALRLNHLLDLMPDDEKAEAG